MTRAKLALLIVSAFTLSLTAKLAHASFLNPAAGVLKEGSAESSHLHETHGCHYPCECGPPRGFGCEQWNHRHLHMLCLPVRCDRDTDCRINPSEGACRHIAPPPGDEPSTSRPH